MRSHVLVATLSSLGEAYAAANQLASDGVLLLELFPLGSRGHFILESDQSLKEQKQKLENQFSGSLVNCEYVQDVSPKVMNAYLSKDLAKPQEALLVIESDLIGPLFAMAQKAVEQNFGILDLRLMRGATPAAYLILTGEAKGLESFSKGASGKAKLVHPVNSSLKNLFQIEP